MPQTEKEVSARQSAHRTQFSRGKREREDEAKDTKESVPKTKEETVSDSKTTGSSTIMAEDSGIMTLEDCRLRLQRFADAREWNQFHSPRNVLLALTGELGEVAELFQWRPDEDCAIGLEKWSVKEKERLEEEISDVFSYVIRLATVCNVDLPAAFERKMQKNEAKYPSDRCAGSSAKYTEYQKMKEEAAKFKSSKEPKEE